jgi:hypothetical protein
MRDAAMSMVEPERIRPFPPLPEAVNASRPIGNLVLRPFGLYERDLNVDFDRTPRPVLVTHLLDCCTTDAQQPVIDQSLLWNLPIGKRIECLLTLIQAGAASEIAVAFQCPNPTCEERSEIELSIAEIAAFQAEAYATDRIEVPVEQALLVLRRPTGSDQLAWLRRTFVDRESALRAMIGTLLLHDRDEGRVHGEILRGDVLRDDWVGRIEEAMDEHDPLVNFRITVRCPSCEADHSMPIDLEELSLRRLRQAQVRLLRSVHRLAAHYHWTEQQIFAVPYWRRAQYLRLIENEKHP